MHLDADERACAWRAGGLAGARRPDLDMPLRHGLVPPGRRMFDVSAEETIAPAAGHGPVGVPPGAKTCWTAPTCIGASWA